MHLRPKALRSRNANAPAKRYLPADRCLRAGFDFLKSAAHLAFGGHPGTDAGLGSACRAPCRGKRSSRATLVDRAAAIEEYGTPAALGRRAGFDVLVTGIDTRVGDWPIDLPGAATLSLLLVALSLAAFLLQRWILARRSYQTVSGKPQNVDKRPLGYLKLPVLALFGAIAFLSTGVPMLAILATALSRTISGGLSPG